MTSQIPIESPPTPGSREEIAEYYESFGRFIEAFTSAENALFQYLIKNAGLERTMGMALFGRLRCAELIHSTRRTQDVAPAHTVNKTVLTDALDQFQAIDKIRNRVVHNRSYVDPARGRFTSNKLRAYSPAKVEEMLISADMLTDLAGDLRRIQAIFHAVVISRDVRPEHIAPAFGLLKDDWFYNRQGKKEKKE